MQHVKKIKFNKGIDANRSVTQSLVYNFIKQGKLTTSLRKAQVVKSIIDRLTYKAQTRTEAHKNSLLKSIHDRELVEKMFSEIAPRFEGKTSGYVRIVKLGQRLGDASHIARVEWVEGKADIKNQSVEIKKTDQNKKTIKSIEIQEKESKELISNEKKKTKATSKTVSKRTIKE